MPSKRKAKDAFGVAEVRLSAVAAARLAKQRKQDEATLEHSREEDAAAAVATTVYEDSVEDEILIETGEPPHDVAILPSMPLSNYFAKSVIRNEDAGFEVVLKADHFLTIVGEYELEVLKGVITIYGATLTQSETRHRVYAPTVQALPQIVARKNDTHVKIHPLRKSVRRLEPLSPLFRGLWSKENRSFQPLNSSSGDAARSATVLDVEKDAQQLCSKLVTKVAVGNRIRVMAIGAKSSGKSTFNRYLCNSLLTRSQHRKCNYLDLDPGQPEFSPPGTLTLTEICTPIFGPTFTHSATKHSNSFRLVRCHALAATTFKDDPDHYISCAQDLIRHIDKSIPLVINSCGWVSGLGAKILHELISILSITDLVIFDPVDETSYQPTDVDDPPISHHLSRRTVRPSLRTPSELRAMQTMASFHHRLGADRETSSWISTPIETWRPWLVPFSPSVGYSGIQGIISLDPQPPIPTFLHEILPGSVVAIVVVESSTPGLEGNSVQRTDEDVPCVPPNAKTGLCDPPDPSQSECLGLALVRGIDFERNEFQLVTPLQEADVAPLMNGNKNVYLVRGAFDAPEWAYLEDLYANPTDIESRPWVSKREMVGIEGAVWRLRHPPTSSSFQLPSR